MKPWLDYDTKYLRLLRKFSRVYIFLLYFGLVDEQMHSRSNT